MNIVADIQNADQQHWNYKIKKSVLIRKHTPTHTFPLIWLECGSKRILDADNLGINHHSNRHQKKDFIYIIRSITIFLKISIFYNFPVESLGKNLRDKTNPTKTLSTTVHSRSFDFRLSSSAYCRIQLDFLSASVELSSESRRRDVCGSRIRSLSSRFLTKISSGISESSTSRRHSGVEDLGYLVGGLFDEVGLDEEEDG